MAEDLFQKCSLCGGTLKTKCLAMCDGPAGGRTLPAGSECPCALSEHPGYCHVGITYGQFEKILADRDRLLVIAADLAACDDRHRMYAIQEAARAATARRSGDVFAARQRLSPGAGENGVPA